MERFRIFKHTKKESDIPYSTNLDNDSILTSEQFKNLYNNHPDAIFTLDVHGDILHCNDSVKKIFGYHDRDLIGSFSKYMKKDFRTVRERHFQQTLAGVSQNFRAVAYHKNGHAVDIDITYVPIFNKEMQVTSVYGIAKDITVYIQYQNELNKIKNSLELAQQVAQIGSWDYDIVEDESYWSNQTFEIYGIENKDFVPTLHKILQLVHPEDREHFEKTFQHALLHRENYRVEYRILRKDGSIIYVIEQADVILDENQRPVRFIGTIQDITRRKLAENKLIESEQRFKNIYNNLEVGVWSLDVVNNTLLLVSPGVEDVTGYTPQYFKDGIPYEAIIQPDDLPQYQKRQTHLYNGETLYHHYRIIYKNSEVRWVQDQTIPVFDSNGRLIRLDGIITNVTEQKQYEEKIKHIAYHDYLTDLPNKRMFEETIEEFIESSKTNMDPFSILFLNIDRFKNINHTLGHVIAEKLLVQFTKRISSLLCDHSLFARLDGDEFGILLWKLQQKEDPIRFAKKIIDELKSPFNIDDFELYITVGIGISSFPNDGKTADELLKSADTALYRAKESGKNSYQIYSTSLDITSFKMFSLERDLRKAIQRNEFCIHLQPRVETATGKIVSAEALIRWEHPDWGLVSPKEFIPLAEENGLILEIGDWVFERVCRYLKNWKDQGIPIVPISINISAQRFLKSDWVTTTEAILKETNVDPKLIEFEITETTLLRHEEVVVSTIHYLKKLGITVALDDFGTGYSSIAYIRQFPIDTIKIDRSFISNISTNIDEMIIKSILYLAKGMDLTVVAEGVETLEQLSFLRQQGCNEIQGYLFSKPVPMDEFQTLLKNMYLKPNHYQSIENPMMDRREHNRIHLLYPLSANMSLTSIKGKQIELGKTKALIEDIGPGGLRWLSKIELPVRSDLTLQFETNIMNQDVTLTGHIVWKNEVDDLFQYGLQFTMDDKESSALVRLLNDFDIQLRENPSMTNASFVQEDKANYLMN